MKVVAIIALSLFAGCATRLTDFTVISTKNVGLAVQKGRRVKAEDCALLGKPNLKAAIDKAIESGGDVNADMLIDGVVTYEERALDNCYIVEGNVVASKGAKVSQEGAAATPDGALVSIQ
jgi:hypothetical protein